MPAETEIIGGAVIKPTGVQQVCSAKQLSECLTCCSFGLAQHSIIEHTPLPLLSCYLVQETQSLSKAQKKRQKKKAAAERRGEEPDLTLAEVTIGMQTQPPSI